MDILGTLRAERAVDDLIDAFHGKTWNFIVENGTPGKYSRIIDSAAKALGQIGTPKAIETLFAGILPEDEFRTPGAVIGLSYSNDRNAFTTLSSIVNSDLHIIRCRLAEAFGRMGDKRAVPYLVKMLHDQSEYVQKIAEESLERLR